MVVDPAEVSLRPASLLRWDGRREDVARGGGGGCSPRRLDDVLAEVGLDRTDAVLFSMKSLSAISSVIIDLPLAHRARRWEGAAELSRTMLRGVFRRFRPVHRPPDRIDLALIGFEIVVEMGQRMVLDTLGFLAQRLEFRQSVGCLLALVDEPRRTLPSASATGHRPARRGRSA